MGNRRELCENDIQELVSIYGCWGGTVAMCLGGPIMSHDGDRTKRYRSRDFPNARKKRERGERHQKKEVDHRKK